MNRAVRGRACVLSRLLTKKCASVGKSARPLRSLSCAIVFQTALREVMV